MTKGGYQIIDLQNIPLLAETRYIFKGIFEKIDSTRKAILVSGLNVSGVGDIRDFFCVCY